MNTDVSLMMALGSFLAMAIAWYLASSDELATPMQLMLSHEKGFPLIAKGDWWGNLFAMSPVLYIVGQYTHDWEANAIAAMLVFSVISSVVMHSLYYNGVYPDAIAGKKRMGRAAWIYVPYFAATVFALGMFYLESQASTADTLIVGILLSAYIALANHAGLHLLNKKFHFPWCPDLFTEDEPATAVRLFGGLVLVFILTVTKIW